MRYVAVIFVFCLGVATGWLARPFYYELLVSFVNNSEPMQAQISSGLDAVDGVIETVRPEPQAQSEIESIDVKLLKYLRGNQYRQVKELLSQQNYATQQDLKAIMLTYLQDAGPNNKQLEKLYVDIYGQDSRWALWKANKSLDAKEPPIKTAQYSWLALKAGDLPDDVAVALEENLQKLVLQELIQQLQAEPINENALLPLKQLFEQLLSFRPSNEHFQYGYASLLLELEEFAQAKYYLNILLYGQHYDKQAKQMLSIIALSEQGGNEVVLEKLGKHYLLPFIVGGLSQFKLLLDTGASMTVITPEALAKLPEKLYHLEAKGVVFNTVNGPVTGDVYTLSQVQVFGYHLDNVSVAVLPLSSGNYQGLLGMNVLQLFEFDLNQRQGKLRLQPKR